MKKVLSTIQNTKLWHPSGDRTPHIFLRADDLSVPPSLKYVVVHCGTSNLDHVEPKVIVDGIMKISNVFQEILTADVKIILKVFYHET